MPQFTPMRTEQGYVVYSFTTGAVAPHHEAEAAKYRAARRNPEKAFDIACERGDYAFASWILKHLVK